MNKENWAIFTDLDGTLIDFETYSAAESAPVLRELNAVGVPVIFCSSKTRGEQQALLDSLGMFFPCIVENGSGLYLPYGLPEEWLGRDMPGSMISWGVSSKEIRTILKIVGREMGIDFKMYSEMDDEELVLITGLSPQSARRAREREFSETLTAKLDDEQWRLVGLELAEYGLRCQCGGRFYTVTSATCNKGRALRMTLEWLGEKRAGNWMSMALGDSANDVDMLRAADIACVVQRPDRRWNELDVDGLRQIPGVGPEGWNMAVADLIRGSMSVDRFQNVDG